MHSLYTSILTFILIFFAELGDKTQLLVLSLSTKLNVFTIIFGIILGSFFSHGIAILFGSILGNSKYILLNNILRFSTYISFILIGLFSFYNIKKNNEKISNIKFKNKSNLYLGYIFAIAIMIAIGEIGDKTFLASIGLGTCYPNNKYSLIFGAILGMVFSNLFAIILGKFLSSKFSKKNIEFFSSILFILFGILGIINYIIAI